jgi:hypothetical protein
MNRLIVQVLHAGVWLNVTSILIEPTHREDIDRAYARAYRAAMKHMTTWSGYFDAPLRIAEETITGGYKEARP